MDILEEEFMDELDDDYSEAEENFNPWADDDALNCEGQEFNPFFEIDNPV